jgi:predicted ATPase/DNA-binding winged helix-turn-helix (wHTH) protein
VSASEPRLPDRFALGEVIVDLFRMEVHRSGQIESLTVLEADLLRFLWLHREGVVSREQLLEQVWKYRPGLATRAVDNTVRRLRPKLERDDQEPVYLKTIYGRGYMLTGAVPAPLPVEPPPSPRTNLGLELTSFVGRQAELARIEAALQAHRLVTLVGMAGCGKTRLAQEHARKVVEQYPGGVWEVPLSEVTEPVGMAASVARVLRAPAEPDGLQEALQSRERTLIVLDNLEQAVEVAADVVGSWLRSAPQVVLLCTSRVPLRLLGELLVEVGPLPPEPALELLRARAQALDARLGPADEPALSELVVRLDGLPLALELAAARLRVWSPQDIVQRLSTRLDVLDTGFRGAPGRHSSLQRAIAWSWDLLGADEQRALQGCAVFSGGFSLESAEEVLLSGEISALVEHSLLFVDRRAGRVRYRMYESVRLFVAERTSPSLHDELVMRHARHFAAWGWAMAHHLESSAWREALELELDNLLSAWSVLAGVEPQGAAQLAVAIARARSTHVPFTLTEELLTLSLEAELPLDLRCAVLYSRGLVQLALGRLDEAIADLEQARQADDPDVRCAATHRLAGAMTQRGDLAQAQALAELAVVDAERSGSRWLPHVLFGRGRLWAASGDLERCRADTLQAQALARAVGDRGAQRAASEGLALLAYRQGRFQEALEGFVEAREAGSETPENVAIPLIGLERYEEAERIIREGLRRRGQREDLGSAMMWFENLARLLQWLGRLEEAESLARRSRACYAADARPDEASSMTVLAMLALERGDRAQARALLAEARPMLSWGWCVGYAEGAWADLCWEEGDPAAALAAYERAAAVYDKTGTVMEAERLRLRSAGLLVLSDPEAGLELARRSAVAEKAVWVEAARELVGVLAEVAGGRLSPEGETRAERALARAPVWPVRFLARRLRAERARL